MLNRLFPIHQPRIGISVSASTISVVELRRPWFRTPVVRQMLERPLPDGLLRPSPTMPHITDVPAFTKELRTLTEPLSTRAVALSLPNRGMHMGVFAFESFPQDPAEREALITWRFREELNLAIGESRVVLQAFHAGSTTHVMAVAVRQTILDQYEAVCAQAGPIPVSMGFSHFQLLSLYRRLMTHDRRLGVVQWADEEFVLMIFEQGRPVFLRTRSMTKGTQDLRHELVGTLQYFADQSQTVHEEKESSLPLYLISSQSTESVTQILGGDLTVKIPGAGAGWQVDVVPLGWNSVPVHHNGLMGSLNGLSAMASVVGL